MCQLDTKKYPWLISKYESWDSEGKSQIDEYEILSLLPDGWLKSFGDLMCEDLDEVIRRDHLTEFRIDEAKEKWGSMRIYSSGGNDDTEHIIDTYSHLSENICMSCGKPDVYMTTRGWVYPCCEDCWDSPLPYEEGISRSDNGRMDDLYVVRINGKDVTYDISSTADRIRQSWKERFGT